jgi:hypothetical protein
MHWAFEFFGAVAVTGGALAAWIDLRVQVASLRRDVQWIRSALHDLGVSAPSNGN